MSENRNLIAAVGYITWVGFLVAYLMGDKTDGFVRHHLNQALVINLIGIVGGVLAVIPILGTIASGVISIAMIVFDILGALTAYRGSLVPLPYIGSIHIIG